MEYLSKIAGNPWALAGAWIGGGLLFALLFTKLAVKLLAFIAQRTGMTIDETAARKLEQPFVITVILIGLDRAINVLGPGTELAFILDGLIKSVAIWAWGRALLAMARSVVRAVVARGRVPAQMTPLLDMTIKVVIIGGAVYFAFLAWHVDVTGWIASAGIAGIALGFAAKDTLANLFAGVYIVADSPYKLGDMIQLAGGTRGFVTAIGLRSTRILTRDDVEIIVPNAMIANDLITNESAGGTRHTRLRIPVGVAYGTDVETARKVLLECVHGTPFVVENPATEVRLMGMGASSLDFIIFVWVSEPGRRDIVTDEVNTRAVNALVANDITIPFPQQDVWIRSLPKGDSD